jgi:cleavage and polyadenylation specificity factor subunit 1
LVDTGAFVSVFPADANDRSTDKATGQAIALTAANGTPIRSYGTRELQLRFSGHAYRWSFIIADVNSPLLGADFLSANDLLVDVANRRLLDAMSFRPLAVVTSPSPEKTEICIATPHPRLAPILQEFAEVFKPELQQTPGRAAKHGIYHHIKTNGRPVHQKFRRLTPERLAIAKKYFADMVRMGICKREASPWAAPLHMTPKADGSFRPCGDYRLLNMQTEPDHYPTPNIADLTSILHGSRVFSKIDLLKGYFQIPVSPEDVPKTAIVTPFGSFVFYFTPFGLRNAGATFQRTMDLIFSDLPFVAVYVDDLLIFSRNPDDHQEHLRQVLTLMAKNGLVARVDKCVFGAPQVDFLGHHVSADGIRPLPEKVAAVRDFPRPTSVKQVQEYTGMLNYYHRFIQKAAEIIAPLYELTSRKKADFEWTEEHEAAFTSSKTALADAALLAHPDPQRPVQLVTDASDIAIGGALQQTAAGSDAVIPIAFFSRKLRPPEKKYSVFDRELLAAYLSVKHFKHWLDGTVFTLRTDHRPLTQAFTKATDAWTARQQRQLSAIAEMNCTVEYIPGSENAAADALSRVELDAVQIGIDYSAMAEEQRQDPETTAYKTAITGMNWQDVPFGDTSLLCDVSTGRPRPLVPRAFRRQVFDAIHNISHPSIRSSVKLLSAKFVWYGLNREVRSMARTCLDCQKSKVTRHCDSGIGSFPKPARRFGHIHVDIVVLPQCQGKRYLLTLVDRSTRWIEAIPLGDMTSATCASALLHGWIARFGVPDDITSDRGTQFVSEIWKALGRLLGIRLHQTRAYRPQGNGLVERSHRVIKASLMARKSGENWMAHLPWVLLGMRTMPREGLDTSSAEMLYGDTLVVPGEFFPAPDTPTHPDMEQLRRTVGDLAPYQPTKENSRPTQVPRDLLTAPNVFVRNDTVRAPLVPPYKGPYIVVQRRPKSFQLEINGKLDWVAIDRLKAAHLEAETPASAPTATTVQRTRRGRPVRPPQRLGH